MNRWWLSLLLIMPYVCGAEEAMPIPTPAPTSIVPATESTVAPASAEPTPAAVEEAAAKSRPTLVEKLKAQENAAPRHPSPEWGNMVLGLGAVLALILGLAWLTKRLRVRVPGMSEQLKIIEAVNLGPREKLCLVVVDGKRLLLGVTQHSITVLNSCDDDKKKDESEAMFSEKIKKMLQNGTPNGR